MTEQSTAPVVANKGALSHLKVLDLSRVLAGPWCTQMLADLGADVIKIERPGTGDDTRLWGPPFLQDAQGKPTNDSAYYLCTNRNKQSIAVDFTKPAGQALIQTGDVVGLIVKASPTVGTPTGAGGYTTFFVPVGTQVVGAHYGRLDSTGKFLAMPMKDRKSVV